jgi:aminomethyltransferase
MSNSKKTPLYHKHVELKAKIVPFAGWDMPVQYQSVKDEIIAVRKTCGIFDVSHMGEFMVEGEDACRFVDHLFTNDVANAANGKAVYGMICKEDGGVIDDLIIYKLSDKKILICVNASNIEKDYAWFQKHHAKFNCTLKNISEKTALIALQGPQSFEKLQKALPDLKIPDLAYYSVAEISTHQGSLYLARTGYTGEDGFEIFASPEFSVTLWDKFIALGVIPCGLAARDTLRIEVGYPLYGHEISEETKPQDAGLKWAVKLQKQDFIGKTSLQNYQTKFQQVKLILEQGIPRDNYTIHNAQGDEIGVVTSGTMSPTLNKGICLGKIQKDFANKENLYYIDIRGKKYSASLQTGPFVQGGHK